MTKFTYLCLCLSLLLFLTGCGSNSGSSKTSEADINKWNIYVEVSNGMNSLNKRLDGYLKTFGDQKEYQRSDRTINFLNSSLGHSLEDYSKALDRAGELSVKGSSDLDKATAKLIIPAKELWAALSQADAYYRNKDYVDDNYAKAKVLHEKIITAYPSLDAAIPEFNLFMNQKSRELRKNEIKEMQGSGNKVMASILQTLDSAQQLQDVLYEQNITSANLQDLKMNTFRMTYDEYVKSLNEYEKLSIDEKQTKKEKFDDYSIKSLLTRFKNVKASAAGLIERYEQKKASPGAAPAMTAGTPEHFDQQMHYLITRYNQILDARASFR